MFHNKKWVCNNPNKEKVKELGRNGVAYPGSGPGKQGIETAWKGAFLYPSHLTIHSMPDMEVLLR